MGKLEKLVEQFLNKPPEVRFEDVRYLLEAFGNINEARELWIETSYEAEDEIPLPSTDDTYSGKLLLRMPKSLHRRLAEKADRENVSLNQYIVSMLSQG